MRPLMVINGFLLGSCLSIAVSLAMVLIVYLFIGPDHPRIQNEIQPLVTSLLIFLAMTSLSALSFYSIATRRAWRWPAQAGVFAGLAATGWYYWP
jgi:Na+/H+ antiporter NhaA